MKQHLLFAMVMCGCMGTYAQTDMTSRIINPSFEDGFNGWTNTSMALQTNTTFSLKVGNTYVEKWTSSGNSAGNASVTQTLHNLPAGTYTLTANAQNIQQGAPNEDQAGVSLVAGSKRTAVGVTGTYSVTTTVGTTGTLNIAFKLENAGGNYVCVDNFTLTLDACTVEQLAALLPAAETLLDQKMNSDVLNALNNAIAAAKAQTNEEGITDVAATLSDCTLAAKASVAEYVALDALLAESQPLVSQKMQASVLARLTAAIEVAQALTVNDNITAGSQTLSNCITAAKASISDYAALQTELENANTYYATSPTNGADELKAAIDAAQAIYDAAEANAAGTEAAVKVLASAVITCHVANATGKAPTVTSEHFMPIGCIAALGRMTATGSNIIEKGYVWATHPNPTVADNRSTLKYENNGDIYELSPLAPATCYYVRAYAMTKTYAVSYGEEQRIYTLPKATCRWSYGEENDDPAVNDRIRNAVRDACEFYNTWTSIPGFHLNAHYVYGAGAGGGTADCSYGGYMRVSQSVSYQRTGTLLHESNHGVGVGTSHRWKNWDGSNMRADGGERGQWMGWRATQMVRFFDHNETSILNGDGTHMWPYGINGAHEDDNRKISYIANTLITHAVHQDGLAAVDGIGASPAYTFEHQDDAKYYITSASSDHGAGTAFLYETSTGTLKWGTANDEKLKSDDSYAWCFEYVPEKAYYRIRNAKSGKYFTYSGSSIKTAKKTNPGTNENFQLMIGFDEVTVGEDKTVTKRPYLIQAGTGDFAPYTLNAGNKGATNGATLNLNRNTNATQRWLILTEEEAMAIGSARIEQHTGRLQELIDGTKAMMEQPHDVVPDADAAAIETALGNAENAVTLTSIKDVKAATTTFLTSIRNYMTAAYPSDLNQPYDITFLIEDPKFESDEYWETNNQAVPTVVNGIAYVEGAKFKYTQSLANMPKGVYCVRAQAYQTLEEPTSYIYVGSTTYKDTVDYIGTDEVTAAQRFAAGEYEQCAVCKRSTVSALTFGITNTKSVEGDKTVFGNFRLYFYGNNTTKDEVENAIATSIDSVTTGIEGNAAGIYDLSGRRVVTPTHGLYIKNGKKVIVK